MCADIQLDGEAECVLNITLLEEPHFRCSLETSVGSPLRLRNSWLVTYAVRYALLRAVHRRLLCRGVSLKIPLGPDWIHSSDMMWGGGEPGGAASAATSEANWSPPPSAPPSMTRR